MVRIKRGDLTALQSPNVENIEKGRANRRKGDLFEHQIEAGFDAYWRAGLALLAKMPVPTRVVGGGSRSGPPKLVQCGTAPFDYYGMSLLDARFIAMEAKASVASTSLHIVLPRLEGMKITEGKGRGVKFHQLEALAQIAENGGIARLVWNNGGEVMALTEHGIINAYDGAVAAWKIRQGGGEPERGTCSIRFEHFRPADAGTYGDVEIDCDWLSTQTPR